MTPTTNSIRARGTASVEVSTTPPVSWAPRKIFFSPVEFWRLNAKAQKDSVKNIHDEEETIVSETTTKASTQPTPVLLQALQHWMKNGNQPPRMANSALAAACIFCLLLLTPLQDAQAAMSGGRMGGSFSASPPSRSYSAPTTTRTYSTPSYRSRTTYYSSPTIIAPSAPMISPYGYGGGFMSPVYPRPLLFGGGGGGAVVVNRGPSFFDLLFWGAVGTVIFSTIKGMANPLESSASSWGSIDDATTSALGAGTSVVSLSVALSIPNRRASNSLLSKLDRLAQTARSDSRVGLQNLVSQVSLELLRQSNSWTSATFDYQHFRKSDQANRKYNQVAVKERSKFEQETVAKYGGVDYAGNSGIREVVNTGDQATMAVVTLVLQIQGDSLRNVANNNQIRSVQDVQNLLTQVASDAKVDDCLLGAEILWTPADEAETLTMRNVIADYPELRSL